MENTRSVRTDKRLTEEQEALRQHGLRLLARIIARRHLASLADDRGVSAARRASGGEFPAEEEGHAR